jgi:putative sterol carrier protein
MATREEIYKALIRQRDVILREEMIKHFSSWNKVMQYYFLKEKQVWHFRFVNGILEGPFEEEIKHPDIYIKLNGDIFCDMLSGKTTGLKQFRRGKIKLKASPREILKLAKLDGVR